MPFPPDLDGPSDDASRWSPPRELRLRASLLLQRAARLRRTSGELLTRRQAIRTWIEERRNPPAFLAEPPLPPHEALVEDEEVTSWFRERVHEILAEGWTAEELAGIGITAELLRELTVGIVKREADAEPGASSTEVVTAGLARGSAEALAMESVPADVVTMERVVVDRVSIESTGDNGRTSGG